MRLHPDARPDLTERNAGPNSKESAAMADEPTETEGAPPEEPEPEVPHEEGQPAELGDAGKQALDRMKAERNAAKNEAKALQTKLEELQRGQMSEQERAIDEAKAAARAEVFGELGQKVAAAEFKAAAAGRLDDDALDTLLENLNLTSFVDQTGSVDTDRIRSLIDGIAPARGSNTDLGQGARSSNHALNGDPLLRDLKQNLGIR